MSQDLAGLSISLRIDPDQFNVINRKLDLIIKALATLAETGNLSAVTASLKASGDALAAAVAQDQPK